MSSLNDLRDAVHENLEARGALRALRARIRAEIFDIIDDENVSKPPPSRENDLVNELVREYLRFAGYQHTLSVFAAEASLSSRPIPRDQLLNDLNLDDTALPPTIPLLCGLALGEKDSASTLAPHPRSQQTKHGSLNESSKDGASSRKA
ncbi:hypothetical protein DFS34DRAFT_628830 [Phlyctochytrium arcticum]|nr:hypothetical protein DFS34DRAFT_628830 [Phlyctochytrium arcticum]